MRIALKTLRQEMKDIISNPLLKEYGIEIDSIVEINTNLWGETFEGIDIISPFEARKRYLEHQIDKIFLPAETVNREILEGYYSEEIAMGFDAQDVVYASLSMVRGESVEIIPFSENNYLDYLEFHTNDHCNLNCKHCNNFSNYVRGEVFTDYNRFEKDLRQLKKIVEYIRVIRILGGEPLLNKEVYRFIQLVREVYPYSDIHVVTNATLLRGIDDKLIETMKQTNAIFEISVYPIMFEKMDDVAVFLKEKDIPFRVGWIVNGFRPPIIEEYKFPLTKVDCNCVNIRNGKLARCPIVQYLDYYNKGNGTNYSGDDAIIDIYEEGLSFQTLYQRLCTPFRLCGSCGFWRCDLPLEEWEVEKITIK